ncbi:unnamed protein product [Victoria cruziana]
MDSESGGKSLEGEMEVEAFKRLFPLPFYEKHLSQSLRPDSRSLDESRPTILVLGTVPTADGSATAKIGHTTMMAAIKLEVMFPTTESPSEGAIAIEFHMPPVCSPIVRPGRPAEVAPVISKQILDVILSSGMINVGELSIISHKAAWMAYLDIYCLDADGSLFDAALLSAVGAFANLEIPPVSLSEEGRITVAPAEVLEHTEVVGSKEKRKLQLGEIPFSLTCVLHKKYILADPNAEEESIMNTLVTIVLDTSSRLLFLYKPGGPLLANSSTLQSCVQLAKSRTTVLKEILRDALSEMDVDEE